MENKFLQGGRLKRSTAKIDSSETIKRLGEIAKNKATDLSEFGLKELDYIEFLDKQLYENLREIEEDLLLLDNNSDVRLSINKIERIMTDTLQHNQKIEQAKAKILNSMEQEQAVDRRKTPCDYPDYDAQGGDDCRNFCGLGVDE